MDWLFSWCVVQGGSTPLDCDWCSWLVPPTHRETPHCFLATANTAGDSGVAWVSSRYGASVGVDEEAREKGRSEEWLMAIRIGWIAGRIVGWGSWSERRSGW